MSGLLVYACTVYWYSTVSEPESTPISYKKNNQVLQGKINNHFDYFSHLKATFKKLSIRAAFNVGKN